MQLTCSPSSCPTCCLDFYGLSYCAEASSCVHELPTYATVLIIIVVILVYVAILAIMFFCFRTRRLLTESRASEPQTYDPQSQPLPRNNVLSAPVQIVPPRYAIPQSLYSSSYSIQPTTNVRILPPVIQMRQVYS